MKEEESVRDQFLVNIEQLKEEIVAVSKRMGEEVEYPLTTGAEGNLTDRLGDLEVSYMHNFPYDKGFRRGWGVKGSWSLGYVWEAG